MSQPQPDEPAALPASQQLEEISEAEILDRNRRAAALLRQWMAEANEEDEEMWPLVEEEFNLRPRGRE